MSILLCWFLSMLVVHLTLKIDVLKMEWAFQIGYHESKKTFCLIYKWKGEEEGVVQHNGSYNPL